MADANTVANLILRGKSTHEWSCFGETVKMDSIQAGSEELIERAVSGLDERARAYVRGIYEIAYWLRSFGGYDFEGKIEEKLRFVRTMHDPLRRLFLAEVQNAELKQREEFQTALKDLKV